MKKHFLSLMLYVTILFLMMTACTSAVKGTASLTTTKPPTPTPIPRGILDQEPTISQIKKGEVTVDGDLMEWSASEWLPVCITQYGSPLTPSPDLDVKVSFTFDPEKFYLAVKVLDDDIQKVDRSWQFGDGLSFTLVTDEDRESSSYVYQFVFDQENKILILRNGEAFPAFDTQDIEFQFREYSDGMDYEIAIPFNLLKPFNPFIYEQAALNFSYTDKDSGGTTSVMLHPDLYFIGEASVVRAGQFFIFKTLYPELAQEASFYVALVKNFFQNGETIELRYAAIADKRQGKMRIRATLLSENVEKQQDEIILDLQPGLNTGTFPLTIGDLPSGSYTLRVNFTDQDRIPVSEITDDIFVLNQGEIEEYKQRVSGYSDRKELEASLSNLEIRFEWLDEFYKKPNYEDISALNDWWDEIDILLSRLEKGETAVFDKNTIKRYAHRSKIDDTLQPYSVFLPESFNPDTKYPLIVFLHGSGMDERQLMPGLVSLFGSRGYPIIAPKARGLSSGYSGDSGEDVFECIEHFVSLYPNIRSDRIFLMGFSMGGTGTWRLGILKPDYFRGLVIISGDVKPEMLKQIDRLREQNIFIIHGAKDLAIPIGATRQAVGALKSLGANVVFIELAEGGHGGDEESILQIIPWIKKYSD
jgi:predicted esterase